MYARKTAERTLTFDFAEGLVKNNLLMVDRETESIWSQLHGRAIEGELEGHPLKILPAMQTTWGFWSKRHPESLVMTDTRKGRRYLYRNWRPGTPRPPRTETHDTSQLGLGLVLGGESWFFPLSALKRAPEPPELEIGGQTVRIQYDADGLTAWAEDDGGQLLVGFLAYRSGWLDFYPSSRIFEAP